MMIVALPSFSTPQAALDARATDTRLTVYIGGVVTPLAPGGYAAQHRAGRTVTATLHLLLPRPAHVVANAEVIVQGGHNDLVGTIFAGTIPEWEASMTRRGDLLEVQAVGRAYALQEPFREDVVFAGPVRADAVFVALCQLAGIPSHIAETPTFPDGSILMLGGNPRIDDGQVRIKAHSSPLSQFGRLVEPYKYAVTDTPAGPVWLHRMLGTPTGDPVVTFTEGVHLSDTRRTADHRDIVNVWDINGETYEDEWGGEVPIRSVADPDSVPAHPDIPGGYRYRRVQNSDLVRQDQADAVRVANEINHSAVYAPVRWDAVAVPGVAPGDVVAVDCPTVEANGLYWLLGMDVTSDDDGFIATYEGWAGAGDAYPGIVDRLTIDVEPGIWHGGDETVPTYANKAAQGTERAWAITIPENASAVNVRGLQHSWNSQTVAGEDTELTVSRWEVWEVGVDRTNDDNRPISSGTMPHMPERYGRRMFDPTARVVFEDGSVKDPIGFYYWSPFAISLRSLDAGDWVLVFRCGEAEGYDDGEVAQVYLELYGMTEAAGATS